MSGNADLGAPINLQSPVLGFTHTILVFDTAIKGEGGAVQYSHSYEIRGDLRNILSSLRLVALLGIAQRQIRIKHAQKSRNWNQPKPLAESIKPIGDWIQAKRKKKNITSGHVAAKMGIATSVVCSWEAGECSPKARNLTGLESLFGELPKF